MCGIAFILKTPDAACAPETLLGMRDEVAHRGPDDEGAAFFRRRQHLGKFPSGGEAWDAALGHRRLSILDLSPAAHQPMVYRGRYWAVHNGEIYNFIELRAELEQKGHVFRSTSDTEVILAAYAEWGAECFARFRGMWGLVLFDAERGEAILSRDRLGIKPLHTWTNGAIFCVASEIKQFLRVPSFKARLDVEAAREYLQTGYEHADRTFFQDVRPLPAGTWCCVRSADLVVGSPQPFWAPERVRPEVTDPREAGRLLVAKLRESVRLHLRSDVPVGCALSGGLDSAAVANLATEEFDRPDSAPLQTFTAMFPGDPLDESRYAEAALTRLRATPHFVTPEAEGFLRDLDAFVWSHDEPVGSLSIYAAFCLARLTRQSGIAVTLNGQGGDEALTGYWQSYLLYLWTAARAGRAWVPIAHLAGALLQSGNSHLLGQISPMARRALFNRRRRIRFRGAPATASMPSPLSALLREDPQAQRVTQIRTAFLPRLLKWDDRNSMAFAVEGRYPFLDHELIELCLSFHPSTLYHQGWTKWPLRLGLEGVLPEPVRMRRSKFGFEVPQGRWVCGPLRSHLEKWSAATRPLWDLVAPADARSLLARTIETGGRALESHQALVRLFLFDRWLERFQVAC